VQPAEILPKVISASQPPAALGAKIYTTLLGHAGTGKINSAPVAAGNSNGCAMISSGCEVIPTTPDQFL
jgi:hypothetical protein